MVARTEFIGTGEMQMRFRSLAAIAGMVTACTPSISALAIPPGVASKPGSYADGSLAIAVRSPQRSPANVARDPYRHPRESLSFWGLKPGMTVLEIWPGSGYWTEILAPYTKATGGRYIAALQDASRPLPAKFADKTIYGDIVTSVFDDKSGPLAAPGTADLVLTARNIHDW